MNSCSVPDATNLAASSVGDDHHPEDINLGHKKRSGQGWYARLSEDKKEEYRKKQRLARLEKKSEALDSNVDGPRSSIIHVSPGKNTYSGVPAATCTPASSMSSEHILQGGNVEHKKKDGQGWYAKLSENKKEEYLHKLRINRLQKKTATLGVNAEAPQPSRTHMFPGIITSTSYLHTNH